MASEVVMTAKCTGTNCGGIQFDVILEPAVVSVPPAVITTRSHTPAVNSLSQEELGRKLEEAEERRRTLEASRVQQLAKENDRAAEASLRVLELNNSFIRESERKLAEKMKASTEKKNIQIKMLRDRLNQHLQRVDEVRTYGEKCRTELKDRIDKKLETAGEKRDAQLSSIQERIRKHKQHIDDVIEQSNKFSKDTEEKLIRKMAATVQKRVEQIDHLRQKLEEHERKVQQVRQNKSNRSMVCDENETPENDKNTTDCSMISDQNETEEQNGSKSETPYESGVSSPSSGTGADDASHSQLSSPKESPIKSSDSGSSPKPSSDNGVAANNTSSQNVSTADEPEPEKLESSRNDDDVATQEEDTGEGLDASAVKPMEITVPAGGGRS